MSALAEQLAAGGYFLSVAAADEALADTRMVYRDANGQVRVKGYSSPIVASVAATSQVASLRLLADGEFFAPGGWSTVNYPGRTCAVYGIDEVDSRLLAVDTNQGFIRQSSDLGVTWSASKGLPANCSWFNVLSFVRFGAHIYLLGTDNVTGDGAVWRALPAAGDAAFSWGAPVLALTAGSLPFEPNMSANASFVFVSEYGDPVPDPSLWRSADGAAWTNVKTFTGWRHSHAVACDPYNEGHVWVSGGDGVTSNIQYSTDNGDSWSVIATIGGYVPQVVQLSFDEWRVWGATDAGNDPYAVGGRRSVYTIDRVSKRWSDGSSTLHYDVTNPGDPADGFDRNSLWGVVDPSSGVYYTTQQASGGHPVPGLFVVPAVDEPVVLLTYGESAARMFVWSGFLWCGGVRRRLMSADWYRWNS